MSDDKPKLEHHLIIEQKIIYLMLLHREAIEEMIDEGYSSDLYDSGHHRIVQAIYESYLNNNKLLKREGYHEYLKRDGVKGDLPQHMTIYDKCRMQPDVLTIDDLGYLKTKFKEAYVSRKAESIIRNFVNESQSKGYLSAATNLVDQMSSALDIAASRKSVFKSLEEMKDEYLSYLQELCDNPYAVVKCDIPEIDDAVNVGFRPQHLTLFVADVASHKSNLMLNVGLNIYAKGHSVLFVPLEMNRFDLLNRVVANKCSISFTQLAKLPELGPEDRVKVMSEIEKAAIWLAGNNKARFCILDADDRISVSKLRREIEHRAIAFQPSVVIIDYVANLEPDIRFGSRNDLEVGEILKSLRFLGKKYGFHVISAAQMGRAAIKNIKEKGFNSSSVDSTAIRGSHEYSADADNIFAISKIPDEEDKLKLYVIKARHGPSGQTKELSVTPDYCRIESTEMQKEMFNNHEADIIESGILKTQPMLDLSFAEDTTDVSGMTDAPSDDSSTWGV